MDTPSKTTIAGVGKLAEANPLFRAGHRAMLRINELAGRGLPESMNPLAQTGAMANVLFIIATVTGILMLIWYRPSLHQAYTSVTAMTDATWSGGILRSLHRYSSDACMFFVIVHALYLLFAGRFRGPRWLAWTTGLLSWTLLEMIGWTGYWLVWDERGQIVATGSAKILDLIPIFADPLSRSFLTNDTINSLFFFVIFFFHMIVPLAMAAVIYVHIARLSRPKFLTTRPVTLILLLGLLIISALAPADLAARADMLQNPTNFLMDGWYLAPLWLLERTTGGLFLGLFMVAGAVLYSLPFWRQKKPPTAEVVVSRCNACMKCYQDCPYSAISMVPRTDDKTYHAQAFVDPNRCVSCGICAGSCDSAGIGVPYLDVLDTRRSLETAVAAHADPPRVLFLCQDALTLNTDSQGHCPQLPGYLVQHVPCLGWIHPLTVERLIKRKVPGVMLAGCGPGSCSYREGATWTKDRYQGQREPILRTDVVDPDLVKLYQDESLTMKSLKQATESFARATSAKNEPKIWWRLAASGMVFAVAFALVFASRVTWSGSPSSSPQLVVSFKHAGEIKLAERQRSAEELEALPVHMRNATVTSRERAPVSLRVTANDEQIMNKTFEPGGIMSDGHSIAIEHFDLMPGSYHVVVEIEDRSEPSDGWHYRSEQTIELKENQRCVVLFDKLNAFTWHTPTQDTSPDADITRSSSIAN